MNKLKKLFPDGLVLLLLMGWGCVPGGGGQRSSGVGSVPAAPQVLEAAYAFRSLNDSLQVHLLLANPQQAAALKSGSLRLAYQVRSQAAEGATVLLTDTLPDVSNQLRQVAEQAILVLRIPFLGLTLPASLHLEAGSGPDFLEPQKLDVPLAEGLREKDYLLLDGTTGLPLFRNYLNTRKPFIIQGPDSLQVFSLKRYEASFEAALPPMASRPSKPARTISVLRTYQTYANDTVYLSEAGLYLIQPQEQNWGGEGLLVEEGNFPEVTTVEELIRPLIYLTSSQERERLYKAADPKIALDNFWLELAGDQSIARSLIRLYYGRVTEANRRYSSHKAGWLTDRGMIFIIFGQPQSLQRSPDREEWYYDRTVAGGAVRFEFLKRPNKFTRNHFELVRSRTLETHWYSMVEKWRRGMINL